MCYRNESHSGKSSEDFECERRVLSYLYAVRLNGISSEWMMVVNHVVRSVGRNVSGRCFLVTRRSGYELFTLGLSNWIYSGLAGLPNLISRIIW